MSNLSPSCEAVVAKVKRNAIRIGGINGIRALSRALNIAADDSADTMALSVFKERLGKFGIEITESDMGHLIKWLDRTAEQKITPTEFIAGLRVFPSPLRRSLVSRVWSSLPREADGTTSISAIHRRFDPSAHPQVVNGERSADEVAAHFATCFSDETNPQGFISIQEFEQYCSGLSATIDSDDRFAATMAGCWRLPGFDPEQVRNRCFSPEQLCHTAAMPVKDREHVIFAVTLQKALDQTIQHHRKSLLQVSSGFRAIGCALRRLDPSRTGFLPRVDFLDALVSLRLYVSYTDVLNILDVNKDGTVDYQCYLCGLIGDLPPARQLMAERLWRSFPTDSDDRVELSFVHKRFQSKGGEELNAFLDAWDVRKAGTVSGTKTAKVSRFELLNEWFVPESVKAANDVAFLEYLQAHWL